MQYVFNSNTTELEGYHYGPDYPSNSTPLEGKPGQLWNGNDWYWLPGDEEKYQASLVPPVPREIEAWQAKAALHQAGLLDKAQELIDKPDTDKIIKIFWEYGTRFNRDSYALNTLATLLGIDGNKLDELFRLASDMML